MKRYKVLKRVDGKLVSPFQNYEYEAGKKVVCNNFNTNSRIDCAAGFYATAIDGLIYTFRNLPDFEVWSCEVGGRSVEINQFKRRYEWIKLLEYIPNEQVKKLALPEEGRVGYKLAEALFPINPFKINHKDVTGKDIELLKQWASVRDSVRDSVWASVWDSVWASVWDSVWASVWDSVRASVWDSVWGYTSSLFPNIKQWKYIDHPEGTNPFQPAIDLWHRGLIPSYDGKLWRLHAGEKAKVVYEWGG